MNQQPRTIQILFDGVEVLRIEDGKKCKEVLVRGDIKPDLIEMKWDGETVYAILPKTSQVLVNRILQKSVLARFSRFFRL